GESAIKGVKTLITYAKNQMLTPEELEKLRVDGKPFANIYQGYCNAFRQNQWMDFDDQMVYALMILRKYPGILEYFQEKYHYISVDEAQDTSKIQHEIIRILASKYQNLFMVGDEDQSIYGFRAAYPQALMEFETVYPNGNALLMEENYRSHGAIVDAANRFIRLNKNRYDKTMATVAEKGVSLERLWVQTRQNQYEKLAEIAESVQENTAILYRDNDSALPLIDLFLKREIPYVARQVECGFFTHFIVRDLLNILKFAFFPNDGDAFLGIYYKLGCGISKTSAMAAIHQRGNILGNLQSAESTPPWVRGKVVALQEQFQALKQETAQRAIHRVRVFMGYDDHLKERNVDGSRADILEALATDVEHPLELEAKLAQLRSAVEQGSGHGRGIILSTIHSSKGLEYDRVILMDVFDGNFPKEDMEEDELEEERRLFYVGMTRAKSCLQLVAYKKSGLESTFVQFLFPPKNYGSPALPTVNAVDDRWKIVADGATVGTNIHHTSFGNGTIIGRDGFIITVRFEGNMETRFHVEVAAKNGCLNVL
ncbi:MAG: ATP-dependent helicase, partial [Eubacteriales bacterium]